MVLAYDSSLSLSLWVEYLVIIGLWVQMHCECTLLPSYMYLIKRLFFQKHLYTVVLVIY